MIAYVKGVLEAFGTDFVLVDRGGLGLRLEVPSSILASLPKKGEEVFFYTHFHVKEDGMQLFGFLSEEDLKLFKLLISVSGVGPKGALAILSSVETDTLIFAILAEDIKTLTKAQGIGNKIAKKIVLEIKDKIGALQEERAVSSFGDSANEGFVSPSQSLAEATEVLKALGFSSTEALRAVKEVASEEVFSPDELVKKALKILN